MGFFKKWFAKDFATKKDISTLESTIFTETINNKLNESVLSEIYDRVAKLNKEVEKLEDRLLKEIKLKDDEISKINFMLNIIEHLNKAKEEFNKKMQLIDIKKTKSKITKEDSEKDKIVLKIRDLSKEFEKELENDRERAKSSYSLNPEDIKSMQLIDLDKINNILLPVPTDKLWKTTDAIIDILNNSKKDLHYKKIYTIIKSYNLSQADLSLQSLKSAMYNLKMSRKIEYGKETGTFRKKRSI